jgi:predicted regulator of Ras-like GTPase activity (Roadblock/LC7/MglB family)
MRPGVKSLEPEQEYDRVGLQMSTISGIHDTTEKYFGKADYTIIHRKKVMMLILPTNGDRIINVTLEPDYPLGEVERLLKRVRMIMTRKP